MQTSYMLVSYRMPYFSTQQAAKKLGITVTTLDRYIATYSSPGHELGKLEFSNLRIEPLSEDAAFVRGSWLLTMPDGKTPHGLFTLIFRKFPDGWKIVHDHTSAE